MSTPIELKTTHTLKSGNNSKTCFFNKPLTDTNYFVSIDISDGRVMPYVATTSDMNVVPAAGAITGDTTYGPEGYNISDSVYGSGGSLTATIGIVGDTITIFDVTTSTQLSSFVINSVVQPAGYTSGYRLYLAAGGTTTAQTVDHVYTVAFTKASLPKLPAIISYTADTNDLNVAPSSGCITGDNGTTGFCAYNISYTDANAQDVSAIIKSISCGDTITIYDETDDVQIASFTARYVGLFANYTFFGDTTLSTTGQTSGHNYTVTIIPASLGSYKITDKTTSSFVITFDNTIYADITFMAYIYYQTPSMAFKQKLIGLGRNGRIASDYFGYSVGVYDGTMVVGAYWQNWDDIGANTLIGAGAAYVFTKNGTAWIQQQKLVATGVNGRKENDQFGIAVAIYNNTIVVGASLQSYDAVGANSVVNAGAVYIFTRNSSFWDQQQKLVGTGVNGRIESNYFGSAVAIYSETVVVGSYTQDYDAAGANSVAIAGAAYIFTRSDAKWNFQQKLVGVGSNGRIENDQLGTSVAIYSETVAVSAWNQDYDGAGANSLTNAGAAYIFTRSNNVWDLQQKIVGTGSNGRTTNSLFGTSVSIYGDTIAVGSQAHPYDAAGASSIFVAGAAYIFTRNGTAWDLQKKVAGLGTNGRKMNDWFGRSVVAYNNTVIAGAHAQDYDAAGANSVGGAGAAYIFTRSGTAWDMQQKIVGSGTNGRNGNDRFGIYVSAYGDDAVIGVQLQSYDSSGANSIDQAGAAYIVTRNGTTWSQQARVTGETDNYGRMSDDLFGYSCSVYGNTAVVGATQQAYDGAGGSSVYQAGAVYVFTRRNSYWYKQQKLVGTGVNGRTTTDQFGRSISIYSDTIVVGAPYQNYDAAGANSLTIAGAVYVFTRSNAMWDLQQKIVGTGTNGRAEGDSFGLAVSIYSETVVVGSYAQDYDAMGADSVSNAGAAYVFTRNGTNWDQQQKIVGTGNNGRNENNYFGYSVSIYSDTAVVGAYQQAYDATGGDGVANTGAAYVFTRNGTAWDLQQKIVATGINGRNSNDCFSYAVSIYNNTIIVGALNQAYDEAGANSMEYAGAAYIFTRNGTTWDQQQKIVGTGTNGRTAGDVFGCSVSIYSEMIIGGVYGQRYDAIGANSVGGAGVAYVFTRSGTTWSQYQKLISSGINGRKSDDYLGFSVSNYEHTILVGAYYQPFDENGANSLATTGAVYIYD